jgi:hypothetical protein
MSEKVEIKTGIKMDKEELLKTDIRQLAIMITSPPTGDSVEGQYRYSNYTRCPWCGHIGWTNGLDSNFYVTVVCGACGQPFHA